MGLVRTHPRARKRFRAPRGGFHPTQLPSLTAWLNWAGATDTGTLSVPDLMGGSPAVQSSAGLKPTLTTADNGVAVGAFSSDVLSLPLSAAINDNLKFGIAFWVQLADVSGVKTFVSVQNTAGGASANKLLCNTFGATLETRAQAVDRRAGVVALDTNWRFCYIGIDCSKATEALQVIMSLDANPGAVFFTNDTAWPSSLGTPTGNLFIGSTTANGLSSPLVGNIGDIYFFSDQLSTADQLRLMQFRRPALVPHVGNVVAFGNSITEGAGLTPTQNYPARLRAALGHDWQVFNCGHSSWTTTQLIANFAEVQSHFSGTGQVANVLIVNEVSNEIDQGLTEATARANMQALVALGRARGWRVLFATTTPRDAVHFTPAQNLACANINTFFRNNPAESDGVIDWAADGSLDDPSDLTWYQDGVHPTAAGAQVMADLALDGL